MLEDGFVVIGFSKLFDLVLSSPVWPVDDANNPPELKSTFVSGLLGCITFLENGSTVVLLSPVVPVLVVGFKNPANCVFVFSACFSSGFVCLSSGFCWFRVEVELGNRLLVGLVSVALLSGIGIDWLVNTVFVGFELSVLFWAILVKPAKALLVVGFGFSVLFWLLVNKVFVVDFVLGSSTLASFLAPRLNGWVVWFNV